MHAREISKCRCVSKRKRRKEHAFNLYLRRESVCLDVSGGIVAMYANLVHVKVSHAWGSLWEGVCQCMPHAWMCDCLRACIGVHVCADVSIHVFA